MRYIPLKMLTYARFRHIVGLYDQAFGGNGSSKLEEQDFDSIVRDLALGENVIRYYESRYGRKSNLILRANGRGLEAPVGFGFNIGFPIIQEKTKDWMRRAITKFGADIEEYLASERALTP